jgi:hypothetical protein
MAINGHSPLRRSSCNARRRGVCHTILVSDPPVDIVPVSAAARMTYPIVVSMSGLMGLAMYLIRDRILFGDLGTNHDLIPCS